MKLVRDKIPAIIRAAGKEPLGFTAPKEDRLDWLMAKLVEEAMETAEAAEENTASVVEELADVLEVVYALCDHYGVSFSEVQESRYFKKMKRGGFHKGFILSGVEDE